MPQNDQTPKKIEVALVGHNLWRRRRAHLHIKFVHDLQTRAGKLGQHLLCTALHSNACFYYTQNAQHVANAQQHPLCHASRYSQANLIERTHRPETLRRRGSRCRC